MRELALFAAIVDRLNDVVGRAVAWGVLAMVLITFFVVVARYGFSWGEVWIQESYVWIHGLVFMLGAGYTLLHDGHVRVDLFYRPAEPRTKAWIDLWGSLLLVVPVAVLILVYSYPYVAESWSKREGSREAGGLQGLFLLKTAIPIFAALVALQALSLAAKSWLYLKDRADLIPATPEEDL